jgi:hypothetical protein
MKTEHLFLTVAQANAHPYRDYLCVEEIDFMADGLSVLALVARFAWVCGVGPDSARALRDAVHSDVVGDGCLALALCTAPTEFAVWLANDGFDIYDLTEVTGSELWGPAAVRRLAGVSAWPGAVPTRHSHMN